MFQIRVEQQFMQTKMLVEVYLDFMLKHQEIYTKWIIVFIVVSE